MDYRITGKFGEEKVWRIDSFRAFGELIDQPIGYQLEVLSWMVLVWRLTDDSPNSPNFPTIRHVNFYWVDSIQMIFALRYQIS